MDWIASGSVALLSCPAHGRGLGTRGSLSPFQTKPFCDPTDPAALLVLLLTPPHAKY